MVTVFVGVVGAEVLRRTLEWTWSWHHGEQGLLGGVCTKLIVMKGYLLFRTSEKFRVALKVVRA